MSKKVVWLIIIFTILFIIGVNAGELGYLLNLGHTFGHANGLIRQVGKILGIHGNGPAAGAQGVHAGVVRYAEQPGRERVRGVIGSEVLKSFEEGFLRGVLGSLLVPEQAQGETVDPVLVKLQDALKSGIVAAQAAAHQFYIRFSHHC